MEHRNLDALLRPTSVAIVGASPKGNTGSRILNGTISSGFAGPIYPINPNCSEIGGKKCYPSLETLPEIPDCVVVAVPASRVISIIEQAAALGTRAAVVVAEGFADAGNDEGNERQRQLRRFAEKNGMAITGPCCMGIASLQYSFANAYFSIPSDIAAGGISVICQSGGLISAVTELGSSRNIGFNYLISSGNEAVVDTADYIAYLTDDPKTRLIACVMEGAKDGRKFRKALERAVRVKPVVMLKLGRSEGGQKATLAHTGTIAGRIEAYEALFRENGVAVVDTIDDLIETAALLVDAQLPSGDRVVMLAISGGATALMGDLNTTIGLHYPELSQKTNEALQGILGVSHPFNNPIDTVGMPRLEKGTNLTECLNVLINDEQVDLIGIVLSMKRSASPRDQKLVEQAATSAKVTTKPVMLISVASNSLTQHWREFSKTRGIPIAEDIKRGLKAVRHLVDYARFRRSLKNRSVSWDGAELPTIVLPCGRAALTEHESKKILAEVGMSITREALATGIENGVDIAGKIGYPVALKVQSSDIPHKSDAGGIHLGLRTPEEVREAYVQILKRVSEGFPDARIDGVLIQEMVAKGVELILGMTYDDQFGPLVMLGTGGVSVELFKDVVFRLPPLSPPDVHEMLSCLKGQALLSGFRGSEPADIDAVIETVVRFSGFVCHTQGLFAAIDINPLIVLSRGNGVRIVDALMIPAKN